MNGFSPIVIAHGFIYLGLFRIAWDDGEGEWPLGPLGWSALCSGILPPFKSLLLFSIELFLDHARDIIMSPYSIALLHKLNETRAVYFEPVLFFPTMSSGSSPPMDLTMVYWIFQ